MHMQNLVSLNFSFFFNVTIFFVVLVVVSRGRGLLRIRGILDDRNKQV